MKKFIATLFCALLFVTMCFAFVSCGAQSQDSETITVTDIEGTQVTIPTDIDKVACISPSATDLMIAFGLGNKIVGTYRSFMYNPWVTEIYPNAANFKRYSYSVAAEELLADGVELVIIQNTENAEAFRNAGIPVVAVHQYSPSGAFDEEVYEAAKLLGDIFGGEAKLKADTELKANVKKYFNYDLTDSDVQNMCKALTKNGEAMVNAE